jgi:hypothetical protein
MVICRERLFKDVAFRSRGVSMSDVSDQLTDQIMMNMIISIASELDEYCIEYSEKLINKI